MALKCRPSRTQQEGSLRYLSIESVVTVLAATIIVVIITEYLVFVEPQTLINLSSELQSHYLFEIMNYSLSFCFTVAGL